MEGALAIAAIIGLGGAVYLTRRRIAKAAGVALNKTVLRGRARRRERLVRQAVLFSPSTVRDPDVLYTATKNAIPITDVKGFTGNGVFIAHERDRLALAKIRNSSSGEIGEIVISVEDIADTTVARFTATSWLRVNGEIREHHLLEQIQQAWLQSMQLWDPGGHVTATDNASLPKPGQSPATTPAAAVVAPQPTDDRDAETVRRSARRDCTACGSKLPPDVGFCPSCGEHLAVAPVQPGCSKCGEVMRAQRNFCGKCGTPRNRPDLG